MGTDRFWSPQSAETVFNETSVLASRLNQNFYTAIPGIVTGFGLLCTFVAILFALLDVKLGGPTNKQFTGLDKLVSGLSGKFLSSIAALLSATVFLLCEKKLSHSLTQSLRELVIALDALVLRNWRSCWKSITASLIVCRRCRAPLTLPWDSSGGH